jgi:hypothetical protein
MAESKLSAPSSRLVGLGAPHAMRLFRSAAAAKRLNENRYRLSQKFHEIRL